MIHGYHVVMPMYGFWLPNDPRGSWSEFVRRWEIARFGPPKRTLERTELDELTELELRNRAEAKAALLYPEVSINGEQALNDREWIRQPDPKERIHSLGVRDPAGAYSLGSGPTHVSRRTHGKSS